MSDDAYAAAHQRNSGSGIDDVPHPDEPRCAAVRVAGSHRIRLVQVQRTSDDGLDLTVCCPECGTRGAVELYGEDVEWA